MTVVTSAALAHASLIASSPAPGARLDRAPTEVRLEFDEPVALITDSVRVFDRAGNRVDLDAATKDGATVVVAPVAPELPNGGYLVSWQVVSDDGHPIRGSFGFTVGDAEAIDDDTAANLIGPRRLPAWDLLGWFSRSASYLGTLLAAGMAMLYCRAPSTAQGAHRLRRWVRLSAWTALAAIIANLLVQGVRLTGAGLDAFGDPDAIALALGQGGAWSAAVSAVGLVVLVTVAGPLGRSWWLPGTRLAAIGPAAAAAAGGFALSGHAVTSDPRVLVVIANALHSIAAAVWFGGLVAVALLLRGRSGHPDEPSGWRSEVVARFSSLAAASLGAVAVTGVLVAWRIEGSWSGVVAGSRGAVLVAKVLVVAVVAALGAWNRTRLVAAVERQALTLRRVVTLEAALLVVVVGLTASLVIMAPNRALSSTPTGSVSSPVVKMGTPEAGPLEAIVTVEPGRSGMNTIVVKMTSDGEPPREVTEVRLRLTQEDVGVGPLRAVTEWTGADTWRSEPVELAVGGVWTVEVFVAVPSGVVTGSTTVTLP